MGEFDQTIGFTLLGVTVNTYLAGVIMPQFFTYWSSTTLWPYPFTALLTAILAVTNQMFQSWRIYQFIRNKVLAGLIFATSLAACGMGVTVAIEWWIFSEPSRLAALRPIVEANLALQLAIDVIVSVILAVIFTRSKTGFPTTHTMPKSLLRNAVQSGSFTAIFAIGALFSFRFSPPPHWAALHTSSSPYRLCHLFNVPYRELETLGEVDGAGIMLRDTSSSSVKAGGPLSGQTNILDLARGSSGQSNILGRDQRVVALFKAESMIPY
ncbi:hypothetical protein DFH06DRAFT_1331020 [Mycena polygramma]|nr:hypothetical protein DFH06DRAFT_1331020 [Mycena polygramma]